MEELFPALLTRINHGHQQSQISSVVRVHFFRPLLLAAPPRFGVVLPPSSSMSMVSPPSSSSFRSRSEFVSTDVLLRCPPCRVLEDSASKELLDPLNARPPLPRRLEAGEERGSKSELASQTFYFSSLEEASTVCVFDCAVPAPYQRALPGDLERKQRWRGRAISI